MATIQGLPPSRTYAIATIGAGVELVILLVTAAIVAWRPEIVADVAGVLVAISAGVASICTGGAAALGYRDGRSNGLTTSQLAPRPRGPAEGP